MTTVFIAGSMNIKHLDSQVKMRIDNIIEKNFEVVVGDADGVDTSIQSYLRERGAKQALVFCSGARPRNNVGEWAVIAVEATKYTPGTRAFFTVKDIEMARRADIGLMIWDTKSTGTLSNVIELLKQQKKSVVFVNKLKAFWNIGDVTQLEELIELMSPIARSKADAKIGLTATINELKHEQRDMFAH